MYRYDEKADDVPDQSFPLTYRPMWDSLIVPLLRSRVPSYPTRIAPIPQQTPQFLERPVVKEHKYTDPVLYPILPEERKTQTL